MDLKSYKRNPRSITRKKFDRLTDTLDRLGDLGGIVHNLETDEIIGGNQRVKVFGEASSVEIIQTLDAPDAQGTVAHGFIVWHGNRYAYRQVRWDEATAAEANIRANIGAGDWDWGVIANEWDPVKLKGFGMDDDLLKSWNSDGVNLREMMNSEADEPLDAEAQVDRAEELNQKWQVGSGDLWRIGEHRLLCGDSTKREDVERVMGGEKAQLCFTDPPFNVGYDYHGNIDDDRDDYPEWTQKWIDCSASQMLDAWFFVMNITMNIWLTMDCLNRVGEFANLIVWPHGTGAVPSNRFALGWQAISAYKVGKPSFYPHAQNKESVISDERGGGVNQDGRITDIWSDIKPVTAGSRASAEAILSDGTKSKVHHAQMPLALPQRAIDFCTSAEDLILEPFAGSGTTIVACQNLSRKCRAIEISPGYCAVILERMSTAFPKLDIERVE